MAKPNNSATAAQIASQLDGIAETLRKNAHLASVGVAAANDDLDPLYLRDQFEMLEENLAAVYDSVIMLSLQIKPEWEGDKPDWSGLIAAAVKPTMKSNGEKAEAPDEELEAA